MAGLFAVDSNAQSWLTPQRHTFRAPAKLEPPTPRTSVLGLDRLAKEKRTAATLDAARKKPRIDMPADSDVNQSVFKGAFAVLSST